MNDFAGNDDAPAAAGRVSRRRPGGVLRLLAAWIARKSATLDPAYFAAVMATGIVSNAFLLEGMRTLADVLFAINVVAYGWLWLMTGLRALRSAAAMASDLTSPHRVFLFFTAVAATDVLGMSIGLRGFAALALLMWLFAFALWLGLIYLGFGVLIFHNGPEGADVSEGAWLNAIVGTQSLVVLGAAIALPAADIGSQVFILLPMLWAIGLALYGIFIVLLAHRMFFFALGPHDVAPPLWIVMGAAAISVNAGSILIDAGGATPFLRSLQPFLDGTTIALWGWATWWIPLLIGLGVWKHGIHRIPVGYSPMLWSIVFPLGMYSAATFRLTEVTATPALGGLSRVMVWVALAAWFATGGGLTVRLVRQARTVFGLARMFEHVRASGVR